MAKKLRHEQLYVAPNILGWIDQNGNAIIIDSEQNINLSPSNIDDKIHIYERQVKGWFLNPAKTLLRKKNNGFIVLMICLSYIEGIEQYRTGQSSRNKSQAFFKASIHRLYPNLYSDNQLSELYKEARCGLFHNGMTDGKVTINNSYYVSLEFIGINDIRINTRKLLAEITADFGFYLCELRLVQNIELRRNFDSMFSLL